MFTKEQSQDSLLNEKSPSQNFSAPNWKAQSPQQNNPVQEDKILFQEESSRLIIKCCLVTIKQVKQSKNAKVHSIVSRQANQIDNQHGLPHFANNLFSIADNIQAIKKDYKAIFIEMSEVNIYALKKLVKLTSSRLTKLSLSNCTFYENDNSAIFGKNPSPNNKMLREINFSFLIKALRLPHIECIDINLKEEGNDEASSNKLKRRCKTKEEIADEKMMNQERLVKEYDCELESPFVNFELKIKPILEKNYSKYTNQQDLVNNIISGQQLDKDQVDNVINNNIIRDVQECVRAYNKYIKNTMINENILIIKGYSLEDLIGFNLVNNQVFTYKKQIKTVIFKETGSIPELIFIKIMNALSLIKSLESIAFFDAQPQLEPSCYQYIKDICQKKSMKFIVLNRSSFDLYEFNYQVFGKEKPTYNYEDGLRSITPKHYAFYLLDVKNNSKSLYEFTPYEFCINEFNKDWESLINQQNPSLEIGYLIQKQKYTYSIEAQNEIKKYQNKAVLTYTGVCEKILSKYANLFDKSEFDQEELKNDILTLLKHPNVRSNFEAQTMINKLKDQSLSKRLLNQHQTFDIQTYLRGDIEDRINSKYIFLREQGLYQCNYQEDQNVFQRWQILSNGRSNDIRNSIKEKIRKKINIRDIRELDVTNLLLNQNDKDIQEIILQFNQSFFQIQVIEKVEKQLHQYTILKCEGTNPDSPFSFTSIEFINKLIEVFKYKRGIINISLFYYYSGFDLDQTLFEQHLQVLEKYSDKFFIRKLQIFGEGSIKNDFNISKINPNLKIKYVFLKDLQIINDLSEQKQYEFEGITLYYCEIKQFSLSMFKNTKQIEFKECKFKEQQLYEALLNVISIKQQEHIQQDKQITQQLQSEDIQNKLEITIIEEYVPEIFNKEGFPSNQTLIPELINSSRLFCLTFPALEYKNSFEEELQEIMNAGELNHSLLKIFYGIDLINQEQSKIQINNFQNEREDLKASQDQKYNQQGQTNNQRTEQYKEKQQINAQEECRKIIESSQTNPLLDYFLDSHFGRQLHQKDCIPDCCQRMLNMNQNQIKDNIFNQQSLITLFQNHSSEYCLFKTSIFQSRFKPKKVRISFFDNFLPKEAVIYDFQEMEHLEVLDFSENVLNDIIQVRFIDLLIQLSPQLRKLKLNKLNMQFIRRQNIAVTFTPFKKLVNLTSLNLYGNTQLDNYPFLIALTSANTVSSLKSLKMEYGYHPQSYEQQENYYDEYCSLLEQNKTSLQKLYILLYNQEICRKILECQNLQKLHIDFKNINEQWVFLPDLIQLPKLTYISFPIKEESYDQILKGPKLIIDEEHLEDILIGSRKAISHLKVIKITKSRQIYYRNIKQQLSINQFEDVSQIFYITDKVFIKKKSDKKPFNNYEIVLLEECFTVDEYISTFDDSLIKQEIETISTSLSYQPLFATLSELYLHSKSNFSVLTNLFEFNPQCLSLISFSSCELKNDTLDNIDFSMLPTSVKKIELQHNRQLSSLRFLEPILSKMHLHHELQLNIQDTLIMYSEVQKFSPCLKSIEIDERCDQNIPLLEFMYRDNQQMRIMIVDFIKALYKSNLNQSDIKIFYDIIFHQKQRYISQNTKTLPFILSPSYLSQQEFHLSDNLERVFKKSLQDDNNQLGYQIGNKYLIYLSRLLTQNQQYILGYSQNYHGQYFSLQKKLYEHSSDKYQNYSYNEHFFNDYLLMIEMLKIQNLKQIYLPFRLEISYQYLKSKNLKTYIDEDTFIVYLSSTPPSEVVIDNMSIQFIKTWYVINSISPLTTKTTLSNIDMTSLYNSSIGSYLTQKLHRNNFFRILFTGSAPSYKYDETVQLLAQHLEEEVSNKKHIYLLSLFPLYMFICIFGVIFFSLHFEVTCNQGISWYSYYCYIAYGFLTLWIELHMFNKCLNYISHLIPSLEIDLNPNFIISFINLIKQSIIDTPWINQWYMGYSYSFIQSQIARFDNFTNIGFLYSTYQCGDYAIFYIALSFMAIPFLYSVYQFLKLILKPNRQYELPTAPLDKYYMICNIIEFRAVSDILDLVSPSNVICLRGRMFNSRIISYFLRIVCENMPLVIIQIYNLVQGKITSSLVLSLILSIITFLSLFLSVLMITPSTLNQEDFNELNEKKRIGKSVEKYEERLKKFEDQTLALRFYENLKSLRLEYLKEKKYGNIQQEVIKEYNFHQRYFKQLFDSQLPQQLEFQDKKDQ